MQTETELLKALTEEHTRTFSAQIDGIEIYRSRYTSTGIEILSELAVDPQGHRLLTFHINENPIPVHSLSLEAPRANVSIATVPQADFF